MLEREFQEILGDSEFKLGDTLILRRIDVANKVGVSPDLSDLTSEEFSVGVFFGVLANDLNIEGLALHYLRTGGSPHCSYILKRFDGSEESRPSYFRITQAHAKLEQRFGVIIYHNFWQLGDRTFSTVAKAIRRRTRNIDSDLSLLGIIRFR